MKEIKAKEGMYLTQAGEVVDRVFVTKLKGANIREDAWRDATAEEKMEYERMKETEAIDIREYEYVETDQVIEVERLE